MGIQTYNSYYDGKGRYTNEYTSPWYYSEYSGERVSDDSYDERGTYYSTEADYGSSYYSFYDGSDGYYDSYYNKGSLMSQSDKERLVDGITQAVANTIGKIALDSINMKSEHKSEYRS